MTTQNLENKTEETAKKKSSKLDKVMSGFVITVASIGVFYIGNFSICNRKSDYQLEERNKTPAYQELVKTVQELNDLDKIIKNYNKYLSDEGKKAIGHRTIILTEKQEKLAQEVSPYTEKAREWLHKGLNPLEYFK